MRPHKFRSARVAAEVLKDAKAATDDADQMVQAAARRAISEVGCAWQQGLDLSVPWSQRER